MNHFWPGALTIIARKHPDVPSNLSPMKPSVYACRTIRWRFACCVSLVPGNHVRQPVGWFKSVSAIEVMEQLNGRIECILVAASALRGSLHGGAPSRVKSCHFTPRSNFGGANSGRVGNLLVAY